MPVQVGIRRRAADAPEESCRSPSKKQRERERDRRRFAAAVTAAHFPTSLPERCAFRSYPPHVLDPSHRLARCSSYRRRASKRHTFVPYAPFGHRTCTRIRRKSLPRERKLSDRIAIVQIARARSRSTCSPRDRETDARGAKYKRMIDERLSNSVICRQVRLVIKSATFVTLDLRYKIISAVCLNIASQLLARIVQFDICVITKGRRDIDIF